MRLTWILVAAVLLIAGAGGGAALYWRPAHHPPRSDAPDPHREGLARATSPIVAMFHAPEGKTPCESAYNAFKVAKDAADEQGLPSPFVKLSKREDFLAACAKLPEGAQKCLVPKYDAHHNEECQHARPSSESLKALYELPEQKMPRRP
jgi:hypothetical protein